MLKKEEIIFEGNSYSCELKPDINDSIICNIYLNDLLNFEGKITLKDIYLQIPAFDEYTMEELFNILNEVGKEKFELRNSSNQYNLKISIRVLKKDKELNILLNPKSLSNMEIIQHLLSKVKTNENKIQILEKELQNIHELKAKLEQIKKEKEENKDKEYYFPDIDISKIKHQRQKELFGEGKWPSEIRGLEGGRIAMSIYKKGLAIIDPESLEILFMIKEPCKDYMELQKDILALIKEGVEYESNQILIIKIEEKKYTILQKSGLSNFYKLAKLWDGTLIPIDYEYGIWFHKEKNNLNTKDFSIQSKEPICCVFQTKKNEIVFAEYKELTFYDFVNKTEIKNIKYKDINLDDCGSNSFFAMISDELLCIVTESYKTFQYCAHLINVYKREKVNEIILEKEFVKVKGIYSMKGKYLISYQNNIFKQYKVEKDNISLIHEYETSETNFGLVFLNNVKNGKFISYDNYNIHEYY